MEYQSDEKINKKTDLHDVKMYIKTKNGKEAKFNDVSILSIEYSSMNGDEPSILHENKYKTQSIKNNISIKIEIPRISKKKFVKLLMGKGIQKYSAMKIAEFFYKKYGYYSELFFMI